MTEKELQSYFNKRIKIKDIDGQIFKGYCNEFTESYDNEPEEASLTLRTEVGLIEIYLSEIASIEVIK